MSIGTDWGGDDDSLAQNMNVYSQVYGQNTAGLKAATVGQAKSDIKTSKDLESQAKDMQAADDRAAGMNLAKGLVNTAIQTASFAASAGAFNPASKAAAAGSKASAAGTKSADLATKAQTLDAQATAAKAAGDIGAADKLAAQSTRVAERSAKLGARSADLSAKADSFAYQARFGGKAPNLAPPGEMTGSELAGHQEAMNIIDAPLTPGAAATGGEIAASGTGFVEGDYFRQDMGEFLEKMKVSAARRAESVA
tara:strand:+ start:1354 stop:2112 length:759 start_codon:yes stop_codon:yes gene_type:complete